MSTTARLSPRVEELLFVPCFPFDHGNMLGTSGVRQLYGGEPGRDLKVLATTVGQSSVIAFSGRLFVSKYGE